WPATSSNRLAPAALGGLLLVRRRERVGERPPHLSPPRADGERTLEEGDALGASSLHHEGVSEQDEGTRMAGGSRRARARPPPRHARNRTGRGRRRRGRATGRGPLTAQRPPGRATPRADDPRRAGGGPSPGALFHGRAPARARRPESFGPPH